VRGYDSQLNLPNREKSHRNVVSKNILSQCPALPDPHEEQDQRGKKLLRVRDLQARPTRSMYG